MQKFKFCGNAATGIKRLYRHDPNQKNDHIAENLLHAGIRILLFVLFCWDVFNDKLLPEAQV